MEGSPLERLTGFAAMDADLCGKLHAQERTNVNLVASGIVARSESVSSEVSRAGIQAQALGVVPPSCSPVRGRAMTDSLGF